MSDSLKCKTIFLNVLNKFQDTVFKMFWDKQLLVQVQKDFFIAHTVENSSKKQQYAADGVRTKIWVFLILKKFKYITAFCKLSLLSSRYMYIQYSTACLLVCIFLQYTLVHSRIVIKRQSSEIFSVPDFSPIYPPMGPLFLCSVLNYSSSRFLRIRIQLGISMRIRIQIQLLLISLRIRKWIRIRMRIYDSGLNYKNHTTKKLKKI